MVAQRYRWDFIGLSSQAKPTKATSDKVTNGSTYYESDTSKLYVFYGNQWYEKTAPGGGGGTSDFDQLSNRPKYNGTSMTHETNIPEVVTYSNFTGTDGVDPGTAGLVPAPATTDAGKFLKADGTWGTAGGGGGITTLTSADFNYPTDNPNSVGMWLLPDGMYTSDFISDWLRPDNSSGTLLPFYFIKLTIGGYAYMYYTDSDNVWKYWITDASTGYRIAYGRMYETS